MAEFFPSQLDYIFFFYGFSFLLLIPICLFLKRRSYRRLPWIWLVWFGVLHGANEGLDLLEFSVEPGQAFDYVRLAVLITSFLCLAEFGRAGSRIILGRGPNRWILAALAALAGVGGLAGLEGLFSFIRYVPGLIGALWAAGTLFLAAPAEPSGARPLQTGALSLVLYALAAGLIVAPGPSPPASWLNYDTFWQLTGLPIQLVRGVIALSFSASLGLSALNSLAREPHFRTWLSKLMTGAVAGLALLLLTGWLFTQHLGTLATLDKWDDYAHNLEMVRLSLLDKIAGTDRLVKILSNSPLILPALTSMTPPNLDQANAFLDLCSETLPESVFYIMDLEGLTIASSNRDRPDSFLGRSYAFRPYFQAAVQGAAGKYWALGVTSNQLGYYASLPVRDQAEKIVGVAVAKKTFVDLMAAVYQYHIGLIIDRSGVVISSSRPDLVLQSLWPLSDATKRALIASRQFGAGPFTPILPRKPSDRHECLFEGKRHMVLLKPIPSEGCAVVLFGSMWAISQARLLGISVTMLFCLLLIGFLAIIVIMRESEEGFRQLFDNANDSLILHDRGRVVEVNQQACRSLGYPRQELLGMSLFDIEVGYTKEYLIDLWEKGGGVVTLSGIYRRKDGLTFPAEITAGEVTYRGQTLRLAAARDVSARKQAEEALRESEEYYRSLFNNMLNGYAYCRMFFEQGRPVDFTFLNVNKAFGDLTGLTGVIGKKVSEVIPGVRESDPELLEMCGSVALTGIAERVECYVESLHMWLAISVHSPLKEYFVILFDVITERKKAEAALRDSEAALRQSQERYRLLAGQLLTAQEAERQRLARELHDDFSQRLAGLAMETERLGQQEALPGTVAAELKQMKDKLVKLSMDVHALSRQLHPSILDDLGLADAVASECARFRRQYSLAIDFRAENIRQDIPPDVALCLYRIVQEGLRNISKHARATAVAVSLVGSNGSILLTIVDDGRGFDPNRNRQAGMGLDSMQERVYLIGGDFRVKSRPGHGTVIEVQAPLS